MHLERSSFYHHDPGRRRVTRRICGLCPESHSVKTEALQPLEPSISHSIMAVTHRDSCVTYSSMPLIMVEGFGTEQGSSLNLDPAQLDAEGNDVGSNWCHGVAVYHNGPNRGSPGEPNADCGRCNPNPCTTPPAPQCEGANVLDFAMVGTCAPDGDDFQCDYATELRECPAGQQCNDGHCRPFLEGCIIDGCALGAICNRDTGVCEPAPGAGTCAQPQLIEWSLADGRPITIEGTTQGAASVLDNATCGNGGPGAETVFRLDMDRNGPFCVSTSNGDPQFDPILYVRTECGDAFSELSPPTSLGCNADIGDWDGDGACDEGIEECRPAAEVHINGVANGTYFIVVDHAQLGGESNFSLTLSPGDCPNAPAPIECALDDHCEGDAICHNGQCLIAPAADAACGGIFSSSLDGPWYL